MPFNVVFAAAFAVYCLAELLGAVHKERLTVFVWRGPTPSPLTTVLTQIKAAWPPLANKPHFILSSAAYK
jgi:hypothetical protein